MSTERAVVIDGIISELHKALPHLIRYGYALATQYESLDSYIDLYIEVNRFNNIVIRILDFRLDFRLESAISPQFKYVPLYDPNCINETIKIIENL